MKKHNIITPLLKIITSKQHSLTQLYLYFTIIVVSLILSSTIWISYSTYNDYVKKHNILLIQEAQKLQLNFDEKITVVEHFLQFIGSKIQRNTDKSIENITSTISTYSDHSKDDNLMWQMIYFINPEYQLVADSLNGITTPLNINKLHQNYVGWLHKVKLDPSKIHFYIPLQSKLTGDYVFPMSLSLYNKAQDQFIGFLITEISIEKLTSNLLKIMNKDISFIILNDQNKVISTSEPFIENNIVIDPKLIEGVNSVFPKELSQTITFDNFVFTHYFYSSKFPFTMIVGYDKNNYHKQFKGELLPKVSIYVFLGVVFTSILLFLAYQVIKPILELGEAADNISNGKSIQLPQYKAREFNVLSYQLENISKITKSLRKKQAQLAHSNSELNNANEFIRSNMSFLSHELTNPISSIIGFTKILQQKVKQFNDEELSSFSDIIYKTALHQSRQLNFFLKLFQFQEAKKRIEMKKINIKEMVEWNVSMIRHHAIQLNIKIHTNIEPQLTMYGDEIMIGQVIQNLASNGAKYNKPGGSLLIKAYQDNKNTIIEITDTGIGIAEKDLEKIFKLFTRIKNKDSKSIGYGIGLTYAKRCVEAHNGIIQVESKLGSGTTFKILFPRKQHI